MSEVPDTAPTSLVIVELATRPRQAFRFAEPADALRLAERLRRADPDAAAQTAGARTMRTGVILNQENWPRSRSRTPR